MKDYLIILAGGLVKDDNGNWHTTLGENEPGHSGILNDRLRVVAGSVLWKENNNLMIVASGGQGKLKDVLPIDVTLSKIIKKELIEFGVPEDNILEEDKTNTTYEQMRAISSRLISGEISGKIKILSNNYHLPRIRAMVEYTELRDSLFGKVEFVGAEDVLMEFKKAKWGDFIEKSQKSEAMALRLESEAKGVEQIKNGTYILIKNANIKMKNDSSKC